MANAVLPETETPIKTPQFDGVEPAHHEGVVLIGLRLSGIRSMQILADESAIEEKLFNLYRSVRPALEVVVGACNGELVAGGVEMVPCY